MTNSAWFNLPVKDLQCSKVFFKELGATFVENETNEMFGIYLGKNKVQVMMFSYVQFEQFTQAKVADLSHSGELLISMEAQSKKEVDDMVEKVRKAGGTISPDLKLGKAGCTVLVFQDPDGHRWNMAFMDWDKKPTTKP